jgi:hypothetical protein
MQVQSNAMGNSINAMSHLIQVQSNVMGDDINATDHINSASKF